MPHTYITSGEGVPAGEWPFSYVDPWPADRIPPAIASSERLAIPQPPRRDDGAAAGAHAWQAVLPALGSAAAMVFILKQFFDGVPIELEDAARVDGASRLRVFWSIVLPLSRPVMAATALRCPR